MADEYTKIDRNQHFNQILIQSPYGTQMLNDVTFQSAEKIAQNYLSEMISSKFYQTVDIHFGVKSTSHINHQNQILKKKEKILHYKLDAQKKYMENLNKAQNEDQILKINQKYQENINFIKQRQQQIDHHDFVPWIYINAKKKFPVYGTIMQDFNRKGMGMLQAKVGYRSVFKLYDKIQFNYESPLTDIKRKYYQSGFTWQMPTKQYGDFYLGMNYANNNIYRDIDEISKAFTVGINTQTIRLQLQRNSRRPSIFGSHLGSHIMKNYHIPSTKYSIKLQSKIMNDIHYGDIVTGQFSELISEVGIPPFSDSKFMKLQYNHRKYFDPFNFSKFFNSQSLMKTLFSNASIEGNFSISMIANRKDYISDLIENVDIRGFQPLKQPNPTYGNIKSSLKFNVYNYPLLGSIKIIPFLYGQLGVSFLKHKPQYMNLREIRENFNKKTVNPTILGSGGIGLAYYFSPFTQIELIYSLFQYQSHKYRQPVNFQIRIGVFD